MRKVEVRTLLSNLTWRARKRLRAGLAPRKRGGQPENRNRLRHGRYSKAFLARRAHTRGILREARALIARLNFAAKWRRALLNFPLQRMLEGAERSEGGGLKRASAFSSGVEIARSGRTSTALPRKPALALSARSLHCVEGGCTANFLQDAFLTPGLRS